MRSEIQSSLFSKPTTIPRDQTHPPMYLYLGWGMRSESESELSSTPLNGPKGPTTPSSVHVPTWAEAWGRSLNQSCPPPLSAVPKDQPHLPPYMYLGWGMSSESESELSSTPLSCPKGPGTLSSRICTWAEAWGRSLSQSCPPLLSAVPRDQPRPPHLIQSPCQAWE
jgi:hypothetical protein